MSFDIIAMNWADWLIISIVVISGLIGMKRGFVKEAISLMVLVAAVLAAIWLKEPLAELFAGWLDATVSIRQLLAAILVFIVVLVLGGVVNHLLGALIEVIGLKTANRFFGMLFGVARGGLIVLIAVLYLPKIVPLHRDAWWYDSVLIPHFVMMEDKFFELVSTVYDTFIGLL